MHVPLLDLTQQYTGSLRDEIEQAIREVCVSQQFVLGPRVTELEERVAEYSHAMTTTFVPFSRASVSQCASGILVVIQFIPQTTSVLQCSTACRSNSTVCCPVAIGCPGGRSVCQE